MRSKLRFWVVSLLVMTGGAFLATASEPEHKVISPAEFLQRMKDHPGKLIDVRKPAEFASGHLKGAENINYYDADFATRIEAMPKQGVVYYLYCRSGNRSGKTLAMMKEAGFQLVYDMKGGMIRWTAENLPQEK